MHGVLHSFCAIYFCFINHLFGIFVQSHTMNRGSRVLCLVLQNLVILVNLFRGLNTLRPNQGPQSFSRDQKRFFKLVLHCQGQIRTSCKNCKTTQNILNSLFGHGHEKMPFGVTHASYPYQSVSFNLINSSKTKTFWQTTVFQITAFVCHCPSAPSLFWGNCRGGGPQRETKGPKRPFVSHSERWWPVSMLPFKCPPNYPPIPPGPWCSVYPGWSMLEICLDLLGNFISRNWRAWLTHCQAGHSFLGPVITILHPLLLLLLLPLL